MKTGGIINYYQLVIQVANEQSRIFWIQSLKTVDLYLFR